jgi:hypothetical protein
MRGLLASVALVVAAFAMNSCGTAVPTTSGRAAASTERDGDQDVDRLTRSPADFDKDAIPAFGQPADGRDKLAILGLIRRYYVLAAAGNGAGACRLLFGPTAETVLEEHHNGHGPPALRGSTCAQIMSRMFAQRHSELVEDISGYQVLAVQVRRNSGYALVRFPAKHELRELQVLVHRYRGGWTMQVPLDNGAQ